MSAAAAELSLRDASAQDEPFLRRVYAGAREEELSVVPWPGMTIWYAPGTMLVP